MAPLTDVCLLRISTRVHNFEIIRRESSTTAEHYDSRFVEVDRELLSVHEIFAANRTIRISEGDYFSKSAS